MLHVYDIHTPPIIYKLYVFIYRSPQPTPLTKVVDCSQTYQMLILREPTSGTLPFFVAISSFTFFPQGGQVDRVLRPEAEKDRSLSILSGLPVTGRCWQAWDSGVDGESFPLTVDNSYTTMRSWDRTPLVRQAYFISKLACNAYLSEMGASVVLCSVFTNEPSAVQTSRL